MNPILKSSALLFALMVVSPLTRAQTTTQPAPTITLIPEKVPCAIADKQDFQTPDRVRLTGWVGTRIDANESNRLVKLDPARLLEGYRKRPGRQTWDGEHVGKWLHAATLAWANTGDPALRQKLDYVAAELAKCQLPDGYLGTYTDDQRWTQWDVWAHKYNLIGLVTYMRYTGNMAPLETCRRMADLLCNTFGDEPGKRDIIPAGHHQGMAPGSVLEPMVLLYRLTGDSRYLDFCKYILRAFEQPNGPKIISTLLTTKRVDQVGDAKAYEMLSCLNGVLEYYRTVGDQKLLEACLNAWQDIVDKRLYITGTASYREYFHADFDLPNVNNVGETCVTVTWLQFNAQLLRLTGEARFAEQMERTTLNQLLGAQCPDGSAWGYYVQMQGKKPYSATLDGHCCLSSGPRGIALIPTFALSTDADGVVINLYDAATAKLHLRDDSSVKIGIETLYPANEKIGITIEPSVASTFSVKLRIPAWCDNAQIQVNSEMMEMQRGSNGYVAIHRAWKAGDRIDLRFPLQPRVISAGGFKNEGKAAVLYGPLVLAADEGLMKEGPPLAQIALPGTDLAQLNISPVPAPADYQSWPGAQVFEMNALPNKIRLVPFADAGKNGSAYKVYLSCRPPRADRNLLLDGVESRSRAPNVGSIIDDFQIIAVTFANKKNAEDWFAVELDEPVTVVQVVFVHGYTRHDGGWFDASGGKPRVQIKTKFDGPWVDCCELKDYPATTATDPAGLKEGDRFACPLAKAIDVFGVRVIGKPACGDNPGQSWSSCSELQAFGIRRP